MRSLLKLVRRYIGENSLLANLDKNTGKAEFEYVKQAGALKAGEAYLAAGEPQAGLHGGGIRLAP